MPVPYRLGLDIGTNSIGWCVFDLDRQGRPKGIRKMGVRIFPDGRDPQSGTSLAAERRGPRGARRRRDRYLHRRASLMKAMIAAGLMPADKVERKALELLDPYALRANGLDQELPLHHFGRALFHLNQRRGFKSNRKADRGSDAAKEKQGMAAGMAALAERMAGANARTLGEYFYRTGREGRTVRQMQPIRARSHVVKNKATWDIYPTRAMYEQEFDALWAVQTKHHPELTTVLRDKLQDLIFFQRPLRPVDPGPCSLDPTDKRAPFALPIVQQFRILQELANLRFEDSVNQAVRRLTIAERNKLFAELLHKEKMSFAGIRKALKLGSDIKINLEDARRPELKGDSISKKLSDKGVFGPRWFELDEPTQTGIVALLLDEPDEEVVIKTLTTRYRVVRDAAIAAADVYLPDGHGRVGLNALRKIVPIMLIEAAADGGPLHYSEAAERAGYDHADLPDGEILDALPYYGAVLKRYTAPVRSESAAKDERDHGRLANPTVHIGMNQVRKLVNSLIERYGPPESVVVELARELKQSREQKDRIRKEQSENQDKNDKRRAKLIEIGQLGSTDGMLRLRLWEELGDNPNDRRCIYTGKQISIEKLFSGEVDIDHILPFADSLDDSPANLIVCYTQANRDKRKRAPFEAFGNSPGYKWDDIALRAANLPPNKRWRFRPDAVQLVKERALRDLEHVKGSLPKDVIDDIEKADGFLARQLIDTQYLSRIARQYLGKICDPYKVWPVPGRLTEFLRRKWGLNKLLYGNKPDPDDESKQVSRPKQRNDHRHHAIDAFVVGLTDLSLLQRISRAAGAGETDRIERAEMPDPYPGFRDDLKARLGGLIVSHRPDHSAAGRLHEETAYGIVADPAKEDGATLVYRKSFVDLNDKEVKRIRDRTLRDKVLEAVEGRTGSAPELKAALTAFAQKCNPPIRHVRLTKVESSFITLNDDRTGRPYKALTPGLNHRLDIYEIDDGTWQFEGVTLFEANRGEYRSAVLSANPTARKIMSIHKQDVLRLDYRGQTTCLRVIKISPANRRLILAGLNDGGNLDKRDKDPDDMFKWVQISFGKLRECRARRALVDQLGRIRDPGPLR